MTVTEVEAFTAVVVAITTNSFSPAGTVTVAGSGNAVLLLLVSVTAAPPCGAAAVN